MSNRQSFTEGLSRHSGLATFAVGMFAMVAVMATPPGAILDGGLSAAESMITFGPAVVGSVFTGLAI